MTKTAVEQIAPHVQEGTIFYSSWGYDQTQVDFYKVVRRTAKTVWVQQVNAAQVGESGPTEHVVASDVPVTGAWVRSPEGWSEYDPQAAAPITKHRIKVQGGYKAGEASFSINSYSGAYEWDGTPQYKTGFGYGH